MYTPYGDVGCSAVLVPLFPFPPVVTCRQDCDSSTMTDDRLILTGSNTVLNLILHPTTVQDESYEAMIVKSDIILVGPSHFISQSEATY